MDEGAVVTEREEAVDLLQELQVLLFVPQFAVQVGQALSFLHDVGDKASVKRHSQKSFLCLRTFYRTFVFSSMHTKNVCSMIKKSTPEV